MNNFEKGKQEFHHGQYQKAVDIILKLIKFNMVPIESPEYSDILWYLGNSRLGLYKEFPNKSLIYEALSDFVTGSNALYINNNKSSENLKKGIVKCIELL